MNIDHEHHEHSLKLAGVLFSVLVVFARDIHGQSATSQPWELGQTVNGFQDDFTGSIRDPNWVAVGEGADHYVQTNGVLQVSTSRGDPNHLLYEAPGYSDSVQEVLARIRVVAFGTGDGPRGGIAVGVQTDDANLSQGLNLHFRDNAEDGVPGRQFKFRDDLRAWGPPGLRTNVPGQTTPGWTNNVWYWLRLRFDPTANAPDALRGKVWVADAVTEEPPNWQLTWDESIMPTPWRKGFAGIAGSSNDGLSEFEVDYILIKADGLPSVKVDFAPLGPPGLPAPRFTSITHIGTNIVLSWSGVGMLELADSITGPWTPVVNDTSPITLPIATVARRFYRLEQPVGMSVPVGSLQDGQHYSTLR